MGTEAAPPGGAPAPLRAGTVLLGAWLLQDADRPGVRVEGVRSRALSCGIFKCLKNNPLAGFTVKHVSGCKSVLRKWVTKNPSLLENVLFPR